MFADGESFEGNCAGFGPTNGIATGELVFNTVMSGYQEVITDPSYAGQVVAFTYPHIGNYGVSPEDDESRTVFLNGIVVRDLARRPSNWRHAGSLGDYLKAEKVPVITGVDTRRLTRKLREHGTAQVAFGTADYEALLVAAKAETGTDGKDLASSVTTDSPYRAGEGGRYKVVAMDFGIKTSIIRQLARIADTTVVPAGTTAEEILALSPNGVFLSNGPGDPSALGFAEDTVRGLVGRVPVFGICLGHQVMCRALGAKTYKLKFGHHGGNHPVKRIGKDKVEITSHNHNYAVDSDLPSSLQITHTNLNDGVLEGVRCLDGPAFSVQYHPEAGPGPHDARYLFDDFASLMSDWISGGNA